MKWSVVALAGAIVFGAANANPVTVIYQGSVSDGIDYSGVFGTPSADLTGAHFTAVYTIDRSLPNLVTSYPPHYSEIDGGSLYGFSVAAINATLTINGVTIAMPGVVQGSAFNAVNVGYSQIYDIAYDDFDNGVDYSHTGIWTTVKNDTGLDDFLPSYDFATPFTHVVRASDTAQGVFWAYSYDSTTGVWIAAQADLVPTSVTVVPEPAMWLMLMAGFGVLGTALRGRRQGVAA